MPVKPLSTQRLYEQLAERIRQQILSGRLNAGNKLPTERELAEEYGVSRTVVREAVKTLKQEGLLEIRAGLGTFVVDATGQAFSQSLELMMSMGLSDKLVDIVEIREILEVEIATLAAQRARDENTEKMEIAIGIMDKNLDNITEFIKQDHAFHLALAEATQNVVLPQLLASIVDLLQELRSQTALVEGSLERGQMHHRRIFKAIRDKDPIAARKAMQAHLKQVRQDSDAALARDKVV